MLLEDDFATELEDAPRTSSLNHPKAWVVRVIPNRRSYTGTGEWVETILRVIEDVKSLNTELERNSLREFEVFAYAHVPIVDSRSTDDIAAAIAELTGQRLTEGNTRQTCGHTGSVRARIWIARQSVVEPVINVLVEPARIWITDLVASLGEGEQQSTGIVAKNREWEPTLECRDGCKLPSTNNRIQRPIHIAAEAFAATDRELVHHAGYKAMVYVEIRHAIIEPRIVLVHVPGKRVRRANAGGGRLIVQTLRPSVDRKQRDGTGSALKLQIAGVVT